jgi:hypothetical protein
VVGHREHSLPAIQLPLQKEGKAMFRDPLFVMALVIIVAIVVTALIVNFPGGVEDANNGYGVDPTETVPLGP